jgi:hypothetical protein
MISYNAGGRTETLAACGPKSSKWATSGASVDWKAADLWSGASPARATKAAGQVGAPPARTQELRCSEGRTLLKDSCKPYPLQLRLPPSVIKFRSSLNHRSNMVKSRTSLGYRSNMVKSRPSLGYRSNVIKPRPSLGCRPDVIKSRPSLDFARNPT